MKSYQRLTLQQLEPDGILVCLVMIQLSSLYNPLGCKQKQQGYLDVFGLEDDAMSSFSDPTQNTVLLHVLTVTAPPWTWSES